MIVRPRNELGIAPLLVAAIPAIIGAVPGIISAVQGSNKPPPPPPCSFWQRISALFGGHPHCSN
jgi:hypothetical protein